MRLLLPRRGNSQRNKFQKDFERNDGFDISYVQFLKKVIAFHWSHHTTKKRRKRRRRRLLPKLRQSSKTLSISASRQGGWTSKKWSSKQCCGQSSSKSLSSSRKGGLTSKQWSSKQCCDQSSSWKKKQNVSPLSSTEENNDNPNVCSFRQSSKTLSISKGSSSRQTGGWTRSSNERLSSSSFQKVLSTSFQKVMERHKDADEERWHDSETIKVVETPSANAETQRMSHHNAKKHPWIVWSIAFILLFADPMEFLLPLCLVICLFRIVLQEVYCSFQK